MDCLINNVYAPIATTHRMVSPVAQEQEEGGTSWLKVLVPATLCAFCLNIASMSDGNRGVFLSEHAPSYALIFTTFTFLCYALLNTKD